MDTILTDDLSSTFNFYNVPQRIISLVPSQTELLYDLGLEQNIVGLTKFCVHPGHLKSEKKIVGGTKTVKYNLVENLKPDLIIANKEENTLDMVETLKHIAPVWVTNIKTLEDNQKMISDFGQIFQCEAVASALIQKIQSEQSNLNCVIDALSSPTVAYMIWKDPYMAVGADTFIGEMLRLNKLINVYENLDRYPEIQLEELVAIKPDVIMLSSEPYPFKAADVARIQKLVPEACVLIVDGQMFSWFGTRPIKAFKYFSEIHAKRGYRQ